MLKFIKKLFLLLIMLLIGGGVWGYMNGMTKDNYKEFISEVISNFKSQKSTAKEEVSPQEEEILKEHDVLGTPEEKEKEYELQPLSNNPFHAIDIHSRNAPSSV